MVKNIVDENPTNSKNNLIEIYVNKDEQLFNLVSLYIKAFAIFLTINAAILKFAFDTSSTPKLRSVLIIFGISISLLGIFVCILGEVLRRELKKDLKYLAQLIDIPVINSNYLPLKYTVIVALVFIFFSLVAWFYLLFI